MQEAKIFDCHIGLDIASSIREHAARAAQEAYLLGFVTEIKLRHMGSFAWAVMATDMDRLRQRETRPPLEAITAERVRILREQTGEGLMSCKRALTACGGNLGTAAEWLRRQGQAVVRRSTPINPPGVPFESIRENAETLFVYEMEGRRAQPDEQTATEVEQARDAAEARLRGMLRDAYQAGYSDGQNNPNGYSDDGDRDKAVTEILAGSSEQ
jgi:hypothetical protein